MIYTSYFSNWRKFPEEFKRICIARFPPNNCKVDETLIIFAPTEGLLKDYKKNNETKEGYEIRYRKQLDRSSDEELKDILEKYNNSIFLCYEKSDDFCHRHILRNYLKERLGIKLEELLSQNNSPFYSIRS